MNRFGRVSLALIATVLIATAPVSSHDAEMPGDDSDYGTNLKLTINVGSLEDGVQRSYKLVTLANGSRSEMLVGWRTPIPTGRASEGEPTAYIYQNVGMTIQIEARLPKKGLARVTGAVEISGARETTDEDSAESGMPLIGTFQQQLDVVLPIGKPVRVAEVPDPQGGQLFLEIQANTM